LVAALAALLFSPAAISAQRERVRTEAQARRVNDRIRALQQEADRLAGEARTLVGDLRQLEIERDLQVERVKEAEAAVAAAQEQIQQTTGRLAALEQARIAQLPDVKAQLVDVYKRGRTGYARLLFGATGVREFSRATRAVAALVRINQRRIAEHRRILDAVRAERAAREMKAQELQASEAKARQARAAAERAVTARNRLMAQIDVRRDLNAQLAGELQIAYERLQQQVANLASGRPVETVSVPLAPFRGALEWPAIGRVTGRFGQPVGRGGTAAVRNGVEIAVPEGTPVRAVHSGTVSYADAFTGFGNLVIVDHGSNAFSLYGYLSSMSVAQGATVDNGAEIGRAGSAPAGPPSLYFEIRVDGRSVDPVQWLRAR
jgi:septal ring factor EnvC (AmiA/AmiB activator)